MRRRREMPGDNVNSPHHHDHFDYNRQYAMMNHDEAGLSIYNFWRILICILVVIATTASLLLRQTEEAPQVLVQRQVQQHADISKRDDLRDENKHKKKLRKKHFSPGTYSVFDLCAAPKTNHTGSSICTFFRPVSFFNDHKYENLVLRESFEDYNQQAWSWQLNNFTDQPQTLQLSSPKAYFDQVESVLVLATPKAGSRTQWQLFLDHLAAPKQPRQTQPRIGDVTRDFVESLHMRQVQEEMLEEKQMRRRRKDVKYAVIREPVSRFLSSLTQLIRMRGTRRCANCEAHLEPCLSENDDPTEIILCVSKSIRDHGFWNEHLIPSAVFLTRPLFGHDLELSVFDLEHLNDLVKGFGVSKTIKLNQGGGGVDDPKLESIVNKLKSDPQSVLTDSVVQELCKVYIVDIEMRSHLGFETKFCEPSTT